MTGEPDWGDEDFEWPEERPVRSRPVDRWRHNTASGAVAAAIALGLQEVFDPPKKETVAIEQEAPDKPEEPARMELSFDPLNPRSTSIVVRPPDPPDDRSGRGNGRQSAT